MPATLIADSGATKCEWRLIHDGEIQTIVTTGISPYFLSKEKIVTVLQAELLANMPGITVSKVAFYGTGLGNADNLKLMKSILQKTFPAATVEVTHDLMAAVHATAGRAKGVVAILGTGSNSCYYNGKKIVKNSPGLGYVLGDEGSGAYLGKKVIQYYLYNTFDEDLRARFDATFTVTAKDILESVYTKPLPSRYLASYAIFLAQNRGHYMIENILEDGLNDFFFQHLCKYAESWKMPIHFVGSIAYGFKDVLQQLCNAYEFELGKVMQSPMEGLLKYHGVG
jgi:glucosamine kinase